MNTLPSHKYPWYSWNGDFYDFCHIELFHVINFIQIFEFENIKTFLFIQSKFKVFKVIVSLMKSIARAMQDILF